MEMSLEMVLEPDTSAVADGRRADRDLALLEALRRHESTAAERLLTTYGERAYRLAVGITGDRKSTRLNSSHGYISYAVFCLKKKKNMIEYTKRQNPA